MDPISRAQAPTGNSGKNTRKRGRIENLRPFPKGVSGNPSGRPKKKPVTEIFEELLSNKEVRSEIKERIRKTLTERGMAGVLLLREGMDRVEGRVIERVEISDYRDMTDEELEARRQSLEDARTGT